MRIGVLGGAGDMGSRAVELLAHTEDVTEVVVLDRDVTAAAAVADRYAGVEVVALDATDHAGTVAALKGLDAVAGALGPFYRFEVPLATAAIEAGVPYVSICDDHEAAAGVLALDERARERGVAVLTGLGWTPGLTNLAARRIHDELGGLDAVRVFWAGAAADATGHAVTLHTLYAYDGHVPVVRDGLVELVVAGRGREPVEFPAPLGRVSTSYVGHPEPVTLPRFLPGLRRVELKGGLAEAALDRLATAVSRVGLTRTHARRERLAAVLEPLLPTLESLVGPSAAASAWRVDGAYAGEHRSLWGQGRMRDLTGVPLACGALLLARGEVERTGAFAPEADGVPHERLWQLLADHGITATPAG
jgi:lysine 6-dehydrogenase